MPSREYVPRPRISKTKYDIALARIATLEAAIGPHWFVVGKSQSEPCRKCGLYLQDHVHKDAGVPQNAYL